MPCFELFFIVDLGLRHYDASQRFGRRQKFIPEKFGIFRNTIVSHQFATTFPSDGRLKTLAFSHSCKRLTVDLNAGCSLASHPRMKYGAIYFFTSRCLNNNNLSGSHLGGEYFPDLFKPAVHWLQYLYKDV